MANKGHVAILKKGVGAWNEWRMQHPKARPNLSGMDLRATHLGRAHLSKANLSNTRLNGADLREARFLEADLRCAEFGGADLRYADLDDANLSGASLIDADLRGGRSWMGGLPRCGPERGQSQQGEPRHDELRGVSDGANCGCRCRPEHCDGP
jgi:hypothetical protein